MNIHLTSVSALSGLSLVGLMSMASLATASECEGILGYIQDKVDQSISGRHYSSFERFFCSEEFSSYSQARDAGVKVGIPIDGVPAEFGGHNREPNWGSYSRALCDAIRTNNFSSTDVRTVIQQGNAAAIDAWKSCVTSGGFHFWAEQTSPDDDLFVLVAKFNPTGDQHYTTANGPVTVKPAGQLDCEGDNIQMGTKIGPGGLLLNCVRQTKSAVSITLSTKDGPGKVQLRAAPTVIACPSLQTRLFTATGAQAQHARVEVDVPQGYKIIGGGARVNWHVYGNLLTASYPENQQKWVAASKDHSVDIPAPEAVTITAWAVALHDPTNEWDVNYTSSTGPIHAHPTARATLPDGYTMTGGGARVNWSGAGNLLTASYPIDTRTWEARSKDHEKSSPANVTAYVIGVKPRSQCVGAKASQVFSSESGIVSHPEATVSVPSDFVLTGGGARVNWSGVGNLLTASYPSGAAGWAAKGKDHSTTNPAVPSPASITVYAVGIHR